MKIGLFGYYKYGNFGDDLMAFLLSNYLRGEGHEVRVYGLKTEVAKSATIDTTHDISQLVDWADCLVYGGGGIFLDVNANRWIDADLRLLLDTRLDRGVPLYAISVGGDDGSRYESLSEPRKRLLEEVDFVTFRNPEDEALAEDAGVKRFETYPDLVWTTALWSPADPKKLISLEFSSTRNKRQYYAMFALANSVYKRKIVDVTLEHGRPATGLKGRFRNAAFLGSGYNDVFEMTRLAQDSCCIFTSRLHYGLVGLASGATTFLVHPAAKARILFERLGLDHYIIDQSSRMRAVTLDVIRNGVKNYALSDEQVACVQATVEQATHHYRKLSDLLETS